MADGIPSYFKLDLDYWEDLKKGLTKAQEAKLALAIIDCFFYGVDFEDMDLPAKVRIALNGQTKFLKTYRENAVKGSQNRQGRAAKSKKSTC